MSRLLLTLPVAALAALGAAACGSGGGDAAGPSSGDPACTPSCAFKACGGDGCGGSCGTCESGWDCVAAQCVDPSAAPADVPSEAPADGDADTVLDSVDNCVGVFNPDQSDLDGDRLGDPCDNDLDGDGTDNVADCAPTNAAVSPGAPELCGDAVDNNCDSITDGEDSADCREYFIDADRDGAGDPSTRRCLCAPEGDHRVQVGGDCDDADTALSPLLPETCDDIDNNCNLLVDDGCDDDLDDYCDMRLAIVGTPAVCPLGGGDCYDYSPLVSPAQTEIPGDGLDNDCDGVAQGDGSGTPIEPQCSGACTGSTVDAVLCAMEVCYPDHVLSASIASPTNGSNGVVNYWTAVNRWGYASNDLAPLEGGSYTILGTGVWNDTFHSATPSSAFGGYPDPYSNSGEDMLDAVELRLIMKAPAGATGFTLDYIFMSAEYEEFIGSQFNDKFYIVLKAPQTTGNQPKIINFTDCSNPASYYDFVEGGQSWCYIAINTAFSEPCNNVYTNISGTGHECPAGSSTGWLSTSWEIQPGEQFELIFHIHDTADDAWDSQVIIDNFRWEGGTFESGTISHH